MKDLAGIALHDATPGSTRAPAGSSLEIAGAPCMTAAFFAVTSAKSISKYRAGASSLNCVHDSARLSHSKRSV